MASGKAFEAIVSIAGKIDPSLEKSISKAQKSTSGLGKGLKIAGAVGAAGLAAVGTASVAMAVKATESAAEYQESFAKTATLLSGKPEELEKYSQAILGLSNDTGIAASELTETVYSAISAGVDQANAVEFAGEAAKLAAGGFTDSATAVDVMTTALNAYGLEADNAGQISDYLITTQNLGKTTVDELASSVGKVIPIASAYGVEMDNLSTAYAQLTAGGIATAEAGTYLKSMLNELGDSGSNVSKILQEETGMGFAELTESGKSLGDVLDILGNSVGGDSGAFNELWSSSEAGVGALSLLNSGADAYNDTLGKMRSSAGATDSAYGTMTNTLSHQIQTIKNLGQNFMTSIGQKILPTVSTMAESAIPLISKALDGVAGAADKILPGIMSGFESFLPVLEQISSTALPQISNAMNGIFPIIQQVIPIITGILPTILGVMSLIKQSVWGVLQQILPIVVKLIGQIGGFVQQLAVQLMPFIQEVVSQIEPIISMIVSRLIPILQIVTVIIGQIIPIVMQVLSAVMPVVTQIISIIAELITEVLSELLPAIQDTLAAIMPVVQLAGEIISAILPVIIGLIQKLMPIIQVIADVIGSILLAAINLVIEGWNNIIQTVQKVLGVFKGIITYMQGFFSTWSGIWTNISGAVSAAFTGLVGIVKAPINTIIGMVNGVIDKINGAKFEIPDWVPVVGGKSFSVGLSKLPLLAAGGPTQGPSIAGEAGEEMVISYDPRYREQNIAYWQRAGELLGVINSQETEMQDINVNIPKTDMMKNNTEKIINMDFSAIEAAGMKFINAFKTLADKTGITNIINNYTTNQTQMESAATARTLAEDEMYASVLETRNIRNNNRYTIESIQFNPTIIIRGDADKKEVSDAIEESEEEFFDKLDEWWDKKTGGDDYEPVFV